MMPICVVLALPTATTLMALTNVSAKMDMKRKMAPA